MAKNKVTEPEVKKINFRYDNDTETAVNDFIKSSPRINTFNKAVNYMVKDYKKQVNEVRNLQQDLFLANLKLEKLQALKKSGTKFIQELLNDQDNES